MPNYYKGEGGESRIAKDGELGYLVLYRSLLLSAMSSGFICWEAFKVSMSSFLEIGAS